MEARIVAVPTVFAPGTPVPFWNTSFTHAIDNGKPVRETAAADLPLAVDHFRYFAGCIRAQEGSISEIARTTKCHTRRSIVAFIFRRVAL
ncbi:hypothetical protein [Cupriavidus sp. 2SB]|uniref:hypothetical protein n=1 Tax=Cupriavidus sp. 2SB TaxID=2502199 RepID=UPI0014852B16|nr:hypothetical protein [Cupriavidus sp. 2SB]